MGKNNRQRRADKAKRRARAHAGHRDDRGRQAHSQAWEPRPSPLTDRERVAIALDGAVVAQLRGDKAGSARLAGSLAAGDQRLVRREAEAKLRQALPRLWDHGWQPAELVRHARRTSARCGRIVAAGVLADHSARSPSTLHPRWAAQVEELAGAAPSGPARSPNGWLADVLDGEGLDAEGSVAALLEALVACLEVGPLDVLLPPPGSRRTATSAPVTAGVDADILAKVRALLAQAESTTFEAEAAAFTAKAQEMMARHAIDHALVWEEAGRHETPITVRVPIDDPYADAKSLLLQFVANRSRCRSVFHAHYSMSSVVGFAPDVAAAELLFTSLLVQSQVALQAEAIAAGPSRRARSRSFRSSFLVAYANRIDQRLAAVNDMVQSDVVESDVDSAHGPTLLPVLAARLDAVEDEVAARFGDITAKRVRGGGDALGWVRGEMAADRAQLNFGDLRSEGSSTGPPLPLAANG